MIRAWIHWRISTAIDRGEPLSPALARKVRRDPECRRFYEASLAMAQRLRADAVEVIQDEQRRLGENQPLDSLEAPTIQPTALRRRSVRLASLATSAVIVVATALAFGIWQWSPSVPVDDPPKLVDAPRAIEGSDGLEMPESLEVSDAEVEELARDLRRVAQDFSQTAKEKMPELREGMIRTGHALRMPLVREAENVAADTRHICQTFALLFPSRDAAKPSVPPNNDEGPFEK